MDTRTSQKCSHYSKNIAITSGDPAGIGPEIIVKSLYHLISSNELNNINIFVIGKSKLINKALEVTNIILKVKKINNPEDCESEKINVLEIESKAKINLNSTSQDNGLFSFQCIKKAIDLANRKIINAVVTAPISKKSLNLAGINFPGHTEIFAHFTKTERYRMLFLSKNLNVILNSIHIPLKEVVKNLNKQYLKDTVLIGYNFFKKHFKINNPKILICGLNPHAGEDGIIGDEEKKIINPVIEELRKKGLKLTNAIPPDTAFFKAIREKYDLIVAMYHDQGLIPLKTLDFYGAVNVTAGIPFIRTSPDHGTAFDIAWKNKANYISMLNAIKYAIKLS